MPAITRLARNGSARKLKTALSISASVRAARFRARGLERGHEQVDVVVEQLDVVGDGLLAPDRWRQHDYVRAGLCRNRLGSLLIEVRLHQDDLDLLPLHLLNELQRVTGRRRNAGTRLDVADDIEPEPICEARIRAVIGHDLYPFEGGHRRQPALFTVRNARDESRQPLIEIRLVAGLELRKPTRDRA